MADSYRQPGGGVITPSKGTPQANRRRGPILQRPPASYVAQGTLYYASDQDGGQEYEQVGGVWVPRGPAVNDTAVATLDYTELATTWGSGAITAGANDLDLPGLSITIVSGVRPVLFRSKGAFQPQLGTAASPSVVRTQAKLWQSNGAGGWNLRDLDPRAVKIATGESYYQNWVLECLVTPPADGTSYQFKVTINSNITNSTIAVFGRNTGAGTYLKAEQR